MKHNKYRGAACILTGLMSFSMTFGTLSLSAQDQQTVFAETLSDSQVLTTEINGDVNADGSFDIADVVLLQKWLLTAPDTELTNWKAADFCDDGRLDVFDLCLMKRALFAEKTGDLKTQTIPVSESNAKLIGRTQKTDGITWLVHSGSAAEFTVTGTEASVTICGDSGINSEEKYRPRYGVYVDGELVKDVVMGEKEQTVELFSGAVSRTATVKIIHLSEANNGCIGVKSITVKSSSSTPVKPTPKKDLSIEFIGDSITCAYGVEAESQYENFSTATENFTLSYYNMHEEILLAYCGCYGVDSEDVELLLEYGYTCDEIEEMLMDTNLLHEALRDVKYMCGESLYESCYGGAF